jgi:hypothetical protein
MATPPRSDSADPGLVDSLFSFTFTAASGDAWGGLFIADSAAYAPGYVLTTAFGRYTIGAETEQGADLTPLGYEDGQVFIEWYSDSASGTFLPTRNGAGLASGLNGFGSESDAAWNGVAWVAFGLGGLQQADAAAQPGDALFSWTFFAASGDRWSGTLFEAAAAFAPGDTVHTSWGAYRIDTERALGASEFGMERGIVRLSGSYFDSSSGWSFTVADADQQVNAGTAGLGSEMGTAWNGEGWITFGNGGAFQADVDRDSSYAWYFHDPLLNDWYGGWLIDDSGRHAPGTVIPSRGNSYYVITGETEIGGPSGHRDGTTWISGFHDGASGRWLETESWRAGTPLATFGLGFEQDRAWDGDAFDAFGAAGTSDVVVENDSIFHWYFVSTISGDVYNGRLVNDASVYDAGQTIHVPGGYYHIWQEQELGRYADHPWGTIWIDSHYDARTNTWALTEGAQQNRPAGTAGFGSEADRVWDGDNWDPVGRAGTLEVVRESDSIFHWFFHSPGTGDYTTGRLSADSDVFDAGAWFTSGLGYYVIYREDRLGRDSGITDGTVWVDSAYDAASNRWIASNYGSRDQALTTGGLGTEHDWFWDGVRWQPIGYAGALQADFAA